MSDLLNILNVAMLEIEIYRCIKFNCELILFLLVLVLLAAHAAKI